MLWPGISKNHSQNNFKNEGIWPRIKDFILIDKNKKDGELRSLQPVYRVQTCEVCQ